MPTAKGEAVKHKSPVSTFKRAYSRLARKPARPDFPVWNWTMSIFLGCSVVIAAVLVFTADALVIRSVKASDAPIINYLRAVTNVGKSDGYLIPSATLFIIMAFVDWSAYRYRAKAWLVRIFGQATFLFGAVALSGLLVNVLKILIGRARPSLIDQFGELHFQPFSIGYQFASMPSGHSTTMGSVTLVAMLWFPKLRWLLLPLGFMFAATRVAANAHYPSDVVAGFTFGFLVALAAARWLAKRNVVFRFSGSSTLPKMR